MVEISEWLNICVGCGSQKMTHGAELPEQCPDCHESRWLCHLQIKSPEKKPLNSLKPSKDTGVEKCHPINDPLSANPKGDNLTATPKKPERSGPKQLSVGDLISQLASQGLGCKAIERKLLEHGIAISYRTVARRLQGSFIDI